MNKQTQGVNVDQGALFSKPPKPKKKGLKIMLAILTCAIVTLTSAVVTAYIMKNIDLSQHNNKTDNNHQEVEQDNAKKETVCSESDDDKANWKTADIGDPIKSFKISYPESWRFAKSIGDIKTFDGEGGDVVEMQYITGDIKDRCDNIRIGFLIDKNHRGGFEGPYVTITVSDIKITPTKNPNYSLVEVIYSVNGADDSEPKRVGYTSGIFDIKTIEKNSIEIGQEYKHPYFIKSIALGFIERKDANNFTIISIQIYLENITGDSMTDEIKAAMATDEYKTAREILLSLE